MQTKNIAYSADLDVLRASAALMVFFWHYLHFEKLLPQETYIPFAALIEEGHLGVSLFMVLSGYLFIKITYGKTVDWKSFAWNRVLRIAPLLAVTQLIWLALPYFGVGNNDVLDLILGFFLPSWPGGGWSIMVELHFYLLLPLILLALSKPQWHPYFWGGLIVYCLLETQLDQNMRYYTIVGRIPQFLIGGAVAIYFDRIPRWLAGGIFCAFLVYLEIFNLGGGDRAFKTDSNLYFPVIFPRWPTEALGFGGLLVVMLKSNWRIKSSAIWQGLAKIGQASYSVYMLHLFFITAAFAIMDHLQLPAEAKLIGALPCVVLVVVASLLTYEYFEIRFLKRRVRYV